LPARCGKTPKRGCKNQATESILAVANFRRSQRYAFHLDLLLKGTYRNTPTTTEDVSFHGVFIRSDEERAPNQLLKFTVIDPRNGEHVELLGIVARCVMRADATATRPPGVGVSLFGNDRATEARWVAIMRQVKLWVELGHKVPPPIRASVAADAAAAAASTLGTHQSTLVGVPRPPAPAPTPLPQPRPAGGPSPNRPFIGTQPVTGSGIIRPPAPVNPPGAARAVTPMMASGVAPSSTGLHAPLPPASPPPGLRSESTPPPVPHGIDATKRAHERRPAKFNVTLRPDGIAALQQFEIKDISEGGTFVLTQTLIPLGSRVNLRLVHPQTNDTFQITGHVARAVDSLDESEKGIGIKFDVDALDRRAWAEFVGRLAPLRRELPPSIPPPPVPGVRVLRGPPDPPILLGANESPLNDAALNDAPGGDPGMAPVILDGREEPVPVLLGPGLSSPRKPN
jgi:Tfp pilus assembly protein PilZ